MLEIKIILDLEYDHTGPITLYLNQGGVRAAKSLERSLKIEKVKFKVDSVLSYSPRST